MTSVQPVGDRLSTLGRQIDKLRQSLQRSVIEGVEEIGERLIEAKRIAGHGEWLPWLRAREMSERSAQNYMKMTRHIQTLRGRKSETLSDFLQQSYRDALKAIQEPRDTEKPVAPPPGSLENVRRFREQRAQAIDKLAKRLHGVGERFGADAVALAQAAYEPSIHSEVIAETPMWPLSTQGVAKATSGTVISLTAQKIEQPKAQAEVVDPTHEVLAMYYRLLARDQHVVAKRILEHQLRQTDIEPEQKAKLSEALEVLTNYNA